MGGTAQSSNYTEYPGYIKDYVKELTKRSENQLDNHYEKYDGERVAGVNAASTGAYNNVNAYAKGGLGDLNKAASTYGQLANAGQAPAYQDTTISNQNVSGAFNKQNFTNQNIDTNLYNPSNIQNQNVNARQWNGQEAQNYMNPYIQNVVDVQKNQSLLDYDRMQAGRSDEAAKAGAFGGSRHGVSDALAQEALIREQSNIQATGLNNAWNQAQNAFATDQGAALQGGMANQNTNLQAQSLTDASQQFGSAQTQQAQQLNQAANMQTQQSNAAQNQFGSTFNQQAQLANQGANMQAQLANQQSNQFGAQFGLSALTQQQQTQLAGAQGLQSAQADRTNQNLDLAQFQNQYGIQQQGAQQAQNDADYQMHQDKVNFKENQLSWGGGILQGQPINISETGTQPAPNPFSQIAGLGLAGYGMSRLRGGS